MRHNITRLGERPSGPRAPACFAAKLPRSRVSSRRWAFVVVRFGQLSVSTYNARFARICAMLGAVRKNCESRRNLPMTAVGI